MPLLPREVVRNEGMVSTAEVTDTIRPILADVNLAVRIRDFVDDIHSYRPSERIVAIKPSNTDAFWIASQKVTGCGDSQISAFGTQIIAGLVPSDGTTIIVPSFLGVFTPANGKDARSLMAGLFNSIVVVAEREAVSNGSCFEPHWPIEAFFKRHFR